MASQAGSNEHLTQASILIEQIAVDNSDTVFVYDLAEEAGFGPTSVERGNSTRSHVLSMQTRAGAGLSLAGRLCEATQEGTGKDAIFTAYNTPEGVAAMSASFHSLPQPSSQRRLIAHVPTITTIGQSLEVTPSVAPLNLVFNTLPDSFAILFSSVPQELVDLASFAYALPDYHIIHVFDHYDAGREQGHTLLRRDDSSRTKHTELRKALQALGYDFFEYFGSDSATDVLIMLNGPLSSLAKVLLKQTTRVGLIVVRVLKPWDEQAILALLPDGIRNAYVFDEVQSTASQGYLHTEILTTLLSSTQSSKITVKPVKLVPAVSHQLVTSPSSFSDYLRNLVGYPLIDMANGFNHNGPADKRRLLFFGTPSAPLENLPTRTLSSFVGRRGISARLLSSYDVLSKPGGIVANRLVVSNDGPGYRPVLAELPLKDGEADFIAVLDQNLIKTHSLFENAKSGSIILLLSTWSTSEVASNLPGYTVQLLRDKALKLYNVNVKGVEEEGGSDAIGLCGYLTFLRLYLGSSASEAALRQVARELRGDVEGINLDKINAKSWSLLEEIDIPTVTQEEAQAELKSVAFNALRPTSVVVGASLPGAHISTWHEAARRILFPDVFDSLEPASAGIKQNLSLRPEIPDNTFLVTCTVNRRLTPLDYDRNVFHVELDTSGTGLKYAIGEALGVHGWNDESDVLDFCAWYGADPNLLITIPIPGTEERLHSRTVFQALQQQIDLFGKPPKNFYLALSDYASEKTDRLSLQFIGSAEGSSTFKKLSEKDTVTFADILRKYPSARPPIEVLCEMIGDIKPRHYSIASAQSVVGDRVDLLVVTVEWSAPSGSPRYGQCTRYLAGLKIGQKVTVSIKPSVMKLPPDDMQPLILAGLGTGAAPFRAFLQHRALLVSQGKPVGPLYYYFGSRHRSKEYLYGEEIEAYILDQTITRCGLAFSRDTKKKVYIQHLMSEDAEVLARMLREEKGVFYLCGPTWPVPDVYEALVGALVKYLGMEEKTAGDYLEGLKEEERYVLEVY